MTLHVKCTETPHGFRVSYHSSQGIREQIIPRGRSLTLNQIFPELGQSIDAVLHPSGELEIRSVSHPNVSLECDRIFVSKSLNVNNLSLSANSLSVEENIQSEGELTFKVIDSFQNIKKISSQSKINIITSPFLGGVVKTQVHNRGIIESQSDVVIGSSIKKINCDNVLQTDGTAQFFNYANSIIRSEGTLRCIVGDYYNQGYLYSKKELRVRLGINEGGSDRAPEVFENKFVNQGLMESNTIVAVSSMGSIINDHTIRAKEKVFLNLLSRKSKSIINRKELIADVIEVNSMGHFQAGSNSFSQAGFINEGQEAVLDFKTRCDIYTSVFYNAAKISGHHNSSCHIQYRSQRNSINTKNGSIQAGNTVIESTGSNSQKGRVSSFCSDGLVRGAGSVIFKSSKDIQVSGDILARDIHLAASNGLDVRAAVEALNQMRVSADRFIQHSGASTSSAGAIFDTLSTQALPGSSMRHGELLSTSIGQDLNGSMQIGSGSFQSIRDNRLGGSIQAKDLSTSGQNTIISGSLQAGHYSDTSDHLQTSKTGRVKAGNFNAKNDTTTIDGPVHSTHKTNIDSSILKNTAPITSGGSAYVKATISHNHSTRSAPQLKQELGLAVQSKGAISKGESNQTKSQISINEGSYEGKNVQVESELMYEAESALIEAEEYLRLSSRYLNEQGTILSEKKALIDIEKILNNHGLIKTLSGDLKMRFGQMLRNVQEATIHSGADFILEESFGLDNFGKIHAEGHLKITLKGQLQKFQKNSTDKNARETLKTLYDVYFSNRGEISSQDSLSVEVANVLQNHRTGRISAKHAINLIAASFICNSGVVQSEESNVWVHTERDLRNTGGGVMEAKNQLHVHAENILNQGSKLVAEIAYLKAKKLIENKDHAEILGKQKLEMQGEKLTNTGHSKIESKNLTLNIDYLIHNLANIKAEEVMNLKTQCLIHDSEGNILSGDQAHMVIDVLDLQLKGALNIQEISSLLMMVQNNFEYDAAVLKSDGMLHIQLKNGYTIAQSINTPGSVCFELLGDDGAALDVKAALSAGKDLVLKTSGLLNLNASGQFLVHQSGGQFAAIGADVHQENAGVVSKGDLVYQATQGSLVRKNAFTLALKNVVIETAKDSITEQCETRANGSIHHDVGGDIKSILSKVIAEKELIVKAKGDVSLGEASYWFGESVLVRAEGNILVGLGDNNIPDSSFRFYQDLFNTEKYMEKGGLAQQLTTEIERKIGILKSNGAMDVKGNNVEVTGQLIAEGEILLTGHLIQILRRQFREKKEFVDVIRKRTFGFGTTKRIKKIIELVTSQEEAKIISNGDKVTINGYDFDSRAGLVSGLKGVFARINTNIKLRENIDVRAEKKSSSAGNFLFSRSATTHEARHTVKSSIILSKEGEVDLQASLIEATAPYIYGQHAVRLAGDYINLYAKKIKENRNAECHGSGLTASMTTGTYEYAEPPKLISPEGCVEITANKDCYMEAPMIDAKGCIKIEADGKIELKAVKLKSTTHTESEGLMGLMYVAVDDRESHESVITPMLSSEREDIIIKAKNGDVLLQAPKLEAKEGKILGISEKGDVIIEDVTLQHTHDQTITSIGLTGLGASALGAIMQSDFEAAARVIGSHLLPPLEAANELFKNSKDLAGGLINTYKLANSCFDFMSNANSFFKDNKNATLTDYFRSEFMDGLKNVGITFNQSEKHAEWQSAHQAWMLARRIVVMGRNVSMRGAQVEGKDIKISGENNVILEGSKTASNFEQSSVGFSLGASFGKTKDFSLGVSASEASGDGIEFINSIFKTDSLSIRAGELLSLKDVALSTKVAYIDATRFELESSQDVKNSSSSGFSASVGLNSASFSAHLANSHSKINKQATGIFASQALHIHVKESTNLVGAQIGLGSDAKPISVNGESLYQYPMPADGDGFFHALGVSRLEVVQWFMNKKEDQLIRSEVAYDIFHLLITGKLSKSVITPEMNHLFREYARLQQVMSKQKVGEVDPKHTADLKQKESALLKLCEDISIYQGFVLHHLDSFVYTPTVFMVDDEPKSLIRVLSKGLGLNIEMWQANKNKEFSCLYKNHDSPQGRLVQIEITLEGEFNLLLKDRDLFVSPQISYKDLQDIRQSSQFGISIGEGKHTTLDASFEHSRGKGETRSAISENIQIQTASNIQMLFRDIDKAKTAVRDQKSSVRVYYNSRGFDDISKISETAKEFFENITPKNINNHDAQLLNRTILLKEEHARLSAENVSDKDKVKKLNKQSLELTLQEAMHILEKYYGPDHIPKNAYEMLMQGYHPSIVKGEITYYPVQRNCFEIKGDKILASVNCGDDASYKSYAKYVLQKFLSLKKEYNQFKFSKFAKLFEYYLTGGENEASTSRKKAAQKAAEEMARTAKTTTKNNAAKSLLKNQIRGDGMTFLGNTRFAFSTDKLTGKTTVYCVHSTSLGEISKLKVNTSEILHKLTESGVSVKDVEFKYVPVKDGKIITDIKTVPNGMRSITSKDLVNFEKNTNIHTAVKFVGKLNNRLTAAEFFVHVANGETLEAAKVGGKFVAENSSAALMSTMGFGVRGVLAGSVIVGVIAEKTIEKLPEKMKASGKKYFDTEAYREACNKNTSVHDVMYLDRMHEQAANEALLRAVGEAVWDIGESALDTLKEAVNVGDSVITNINEQANHFYRKELSDSTTAAGKVHVRAQRGEELSLTDRFVLSNTREEAFKRAIFETTKDGMTSAGKSGVSFFANSIESARHDPYLQEQGARIERENPMSHFLKEAK